MQAFFINFGSQTVKENAEFFNFNEDQSDDVTIFDVRALFNRLA